MDIKTNRQRIKGVVALSSVFFLLLGHLLSVVSIFSFAQATYGGLKSKNDFFREFYLSFGSHSGTCEILADGSITFHRVGMSPTLDIILKISLPLILYLCWYIIQKARKKWNLL